jgi:hypothetical protein
MLPIFLLQTGQPLHLPGREQMGLSTPHQREHVVGVASAGSGLLTGRRQPLLRVLADGREHQEAGAAAQAGTLEHEALLDERLQHVEVAGTYRLDRLQITPARKHRQRPEEQSLVLGQQVVAPVDRGAQCALP